MPNTSQALLFDFPIYTRAEQAADRVVHLVGLAAALIGIAWLASRLPPAATTKQVVTVAVYGAGLLGMLSASALYNHARPGRLKAVFHQIDHAMIFVMIAGSYTPFVLNALSPGLGIPVCILVWALAAGGVGLKLACRGCSYAVFLLMYLGMGWLGLGILPPLWTALPSDALALLATGGAVYSLGSLVHAWARLPFYNVVWHTMVVIAAGLHLMAVARLFPQLG